MIRPDEAAPTSVQSPHRRDPGPDDPPPLAPAGVEEDPFAPPAWIARAGRRTLREKLVAGLLGIKHAVRGDSSFFAHGYRAVLVLLTAGMIGVPAVGWCMLVVGLGLVLIAELTHSAVDTLARAIGDPEEPRLRMARDIAAAGVLVAVVISAAISITVLTLKLGDYLGWWDRSMWDAR